MLVGSGGVIALVVGAWAVLWALVRSPGPTWRTRYPVVAAFLAAMLGFAMLTAQSEIGLGLIDWARGAPEDRAAVVADTLSTAWRPLAAVVLGALAFGATLFATRKPSSPFDDHPPHLVEKLAVGVMAGLALLDIGLWLALRSLFATAVAGREGWLASVPQIQLLTAVGALAAVGLVALAAFVGGWRTLRRRTAHPG